MEDKLREWGFRKIGPKAWVRGDLVITLTWDDREAWNLYQQGWGSLGFGHGTEALEAKLP
jgi:hypothetical protein